MRRSELVAAGSASALLALSSSPFFLPFSSFIALALYVWVVRKSERPFCLSFAVSLPYWFLHSYWIMNLDVPSSIRPLLLLGVLAMTSTLASFYGLWGWSVKRMDGWKAFFLIPSVWVMWEFFRGEMLGDLSYPWAPLGESLVKSPFLDLAAIGGVYFLSFFVVLVGTLLAFRKWIWAATVLILASLWSSVYSPKVKGKFKVAVLQPNVLPRLAYDPKEWEEVDSAYGRLLDEIEGKNVDLIVGAESAFPGIYMYSSKSKAWVRRITKKAPFLFGTAGVEKGPRFYNRALLVDTNGDVIGKHDKVRLVPFGENLPFYEHLPSFIRNLQLGQGNYSRGRGFWPVDAGGVKLGVMICYESIFPYIGWRLVRRGADVLVVMTSDGWFGRSVGPLEHYYLGIIRGVETGRSVIRAAKTGISAVVDAEGKQIKKLPLYTEGAIVEEVPLYEGDSPFVRFGFLIPPLLALLGALWHVYHFISHH